MNARVVWSFLLALPFLGSSAGAGDTTQKDLEKLEALVEVVVKPYKNDSAHHKERLAAFAELFDTVEARQDLTSGLPRDAAKIARNTAGEPEEFKLLRRVACQHLFWRANKLPSGLCNVTDPDDVERFLIHIFRDNPIKGYEACALKYLPELLKRFDPTKLPFATYETILDSRWKWKRFRSCVSPEFLVTWAINVAQDLEAQDRKTWCARLSEYLIKNAPEDSKERYVREVATSYYAHYSAGSYTFQNDRKELLLRIFGTTLRPIIGRRPDLLWPVVRDHFGSLATPWYLGEEFYSAVASLTAPRTEVATIPMAAELTEYDQFRILLWELMVKMNQSVEHSAKKQLRLATKTFNAVHQVFQRDYKRMFLEIWNADAYNLAQTLLTKPGTALKVFFPRTLFADHPKCSPLVLATLLDHLGDDLVVPDVEICGDVYRLWREARSVRRSLPTEPCGEGTSPPLQLHVFPHELLQSQCRDTGPFYLRILMLFYQGIPLEHTIGLQPLHGERHDIRDLLSIGSIVSERYCQLKGGSPTTQIALKKEMTAS